MGWQCGGDAGRGGGGVGVDVGSMKYLKVPQVTLDWAVLIFSGMVAGVIGFFVTWGHFQKDPVVGKE